MTSSTSCRVIFAPIDFKTRMCLPKVPGYYLLGDAYYRKGAYAAALVKTSDNFYVFVTLSGLSLNKNTVDMLGGIVGDDMPVRSGADLFEVMYKEMEEEGAIPKESVEKCVLRVVFLNQKTNVGFYFDVQLKDTMAQIEERYQKLGKDTDISGLLFVQEADLPTQLESMGGSKTFLKRVYFDD